MLAGNNWLFEIDHSWIAHIIWVTRLRVVIFNRIIYLVWSNCFIDNFINSTKSLELARRVVWWSCWFATTFAKFNYFRLNFNIGFQKFVVISNWAIFEFFRVIFVAFACRWWFFFIFFWFSFWFWSSMKCFFLVKHILLFNFSYILQCSNKVLNVK